MMHIDCSACRQSIFEVIPHQFLKSLSKQKYAALYFLAIAMVFLAISVIEVCAGEGGYSLVLPMLFFTLFGHTIHNIRAIRRKWHFYWFVKDRCIVVLNGYGNVTTYIPIDNVCAVEVRNLSFRWGGYYATEMVQKYICILFDDETQIQAVVKKGNHLRYCLDNIFTEHYYIISYSLGALEILKQHLDVPVIIEDEE